MNILLVAATSFELAPTLSFLRANFANEPDGCFTKKGIRLRALISGVGLTATAWQLGRVLSSSAYQLAINAGVAGAFDRSLKLGSVVQVLSERFGDLGVEESDGQFTDVFELGLQAPNQLPFINGSLHNQAASESPFLPGVKGLTVNRVHGSSASIQLIQKKYPDVQIETMESAAFFFGCLSAGLPFISLRSISNYVEPRNRDAWELELAIEQLNLVLIELLQTLTPPLP